MIEFHNRGGNAPTYAGQRKASHNSNEWGTAILSQARLSAGPMSTCKRTECAMVRNGSPSTSEPVPESHRSRPSASGRDAYLRCWRIEVLPPPSREDSPAALSIGCYRPELSGSTSYGGMPFPAPPE